MTNLPFHDGRSFALYLKSEAKKKGISMYKLFEMGVIESIGENLRYRLSYLTLDNDLFYKDLII